VRRAFRVTRARTRLRQGTCVTRPIGSVWRGSTAARRCDVSACVVRMRTVLKGGHARRSRVRSERWERAGWRRLTRGRMRSRTRSRMRRAVREAQAVRRGLAVLPGRRGAAGLRRLAPMRSPPTRAVTRGMTMGVVAGRPGRRGPGSGGCCSWSVLVSGWCGGARLSEGRPEQRLCREPRPVLWRVGA
jgi:hypothetical protein